MWLRDGLLTPIEDGDPPAKRSPARRLRVAPVDACLGSLKDCAWHLPPRVYPGWTSLRREGRVDTCHKGGLKGACLGNSDAFEELSAVLAAYHDGVDILHRQGIAV